MMRIHYSEIPKLGWSRLDGTYFGKSILLAKRPHQIFSLTL